MPLPYPGEFKYGQRGPKVEAVARALARSGSGDRLAVFVLLPKRVRQTWGKRKQRALIKFKRKHGLTPNARYGRTVHAKLTPFFDAKARRLLTQPVRPPDPKVAAYNKLLAVMKQMSAQTPGYVFGGGHGSPLDQIRYTQGLDCSSSTSKALHDAGFFPGRYCLVSGQFGSWGEPGPGKFFTVYYNTEHVWIRLNRGIYWRFDTSPHGSGGRGPRLRLLPRGTSGFHARHWKGM